MYICSRTPPHVPILSSLSLSRSPPARSLALRRTASQHPPSRYDSTMASRFGGFLCFSFLFLASDVSGASFSFANNCEYTVWPGLLASAGSPPLATTGFPLGKGESRTLSAPSGWSGRFWGRTLCSTDASGKFSCLTGDCGSGNVECSGSGAAPPATLAEFTLDGSGAMDFYDVSLVDGYNLPMLVLPQGAAGGVNSTCVSTGCVVELNGACPSELKVTESSGEGVACRSACEAFGKPEFCCSGEFGNPNTCRPTTYSQFFKNACPRAYSYAYDDSTSTFTCPGGTSYLITFCPTTSSQKSSEKPQAVPVPSGGNTAMVYNGALVRGAAAGGAAASYRWAFFLLAAASLLRF